MGTYVSTNILMHFSDKDQFDEVVKIMSVKLNFDGVDYKIYDQIEFQNTSAGPQLIGLNPPDALKYATAS